MSANPVTSQAADLEAAIEVLGRGTFAIATGAGVSTDSGIPDYRGEGSPPRTPMTAAQFTDDPQFRKRYWAGSQLGWRRFSTVQPNAGHVAIARLEAGGLSPGVITQNVDGLHRRAGSQHVIELHGSGDRVRCLSCDQLFSREAIAARVAIENPWLAEVPEGELGPDGDVHITDLDNFITPVCTVCGGTLKPDIVYFGEFIPTDRFAAARAMISSADALLIAGTSLVVNSGIRLLEVALRRGMPVVIVNRGATRGDERATVKLDAGTTPTLTALADRLIGPGRAD